MTRPWPVVLLAFLTFVAVQRGQQPDQPELTEAERLAQVESRLELVERAVSSPAGDGSLEISPNVLEARLSRIEMRLDRVERQAARAGGVASATADRVLEGRVRALESAILRLQR